MSIPDRFLFCFGLEEKGDFGWKNPADLIFLNCGKNSLNVFPLMSNTTLLLM